MKHTIEPFFSAADCIATARDFADNNRGVFAVVYEGSATGYRVMAHDHAQRAGAQIAAVIKPRPITQEEADRRALQNHVNQRAAAPKYTEFQPSLMPDVPDDNGQVSLF